MKREVTVSIRKDRGDWRVDVSDEHGCEFASTFSKHPAAALRMAVPYIEDVLLSEPESLEPAA